MAGDAVRCLPLVLTCTDRTDLVGLDTSRDPGSPASWGNDWGNRDAGPALISFERGLVHSLFQPSEVALDPPAKRLAHLNPYVTGEVGTHR
jgi:hypothetical protein